MPRYPRPWQDRCSEKFDRGAPEACWLWRGSLSSDGYGRVRTGGRGSPEMTAHRAVYTMDVGPIPDGLTLDHLCRNRACVNSAHMQPVTGVENTMRGAGVGALNAAKDRCPKCGGPYTHTPRGDGRTYRRCRPCQNAFYRAQRAVRA